MFEHKFETGCLAGCCSLDGEVYKVAGKLHRDSDVETEAYTASVGCSFASESEESDSDNDSSESESEADEAWVTSRPRISHTLTADNDSSESESEADEAWVTSQPRISLALTATWLRAEEGDEEEHEDPSYHSLFQMPRMRQRSVSHETVDSAVVAQQSEKLICVRWPPSKTASTKAYNQREKQALDDEVRKRANELCMWSMMVRQAERNHHLYHEDTIGTDAEGSTHKANARVRHRAAVRRSATSFNQTYADAQDALNEAIHDHLCLMTQPELQARRRCNTADLGEVARAVSPLESCAISEGRLSSLASMATEQKVS